MGYRGCRRWRVILLPGDIAEPQEEGQNTPGDDALIIHVETGSGDEGAILPARGRTRPDARDGNVAGDGS